MDKKIELAIIENLDYDRDAGKLFWRNNMGRNLVKGKEAGSIKPSGYIYIKVARKFIIAHRIAWFLFYGEWPEKEIDHIDGDPTNNRIENLRDVSTRINQGNQKIHRAGRLVGTTFLRNCSRNPWQAQIELNGKNFYLGCFPTEKEAHEAYMEMAQA